MAASSFKFAGTGGAAVALSATIPAGQCHRLVSVAIHLSAAPVTAGALTVKLNAAEGSDHDTLLQTVAMVGVTDYVWLPDEDLFGFGGDAFDVAYANPDARTYGVRVTTKAV